MAGRKCDHIAQSIRALLDLPRYVVVAAKRWAGWGRLTLVPRRCGFVAPGVGRQSPKAERVDGSRSVISTSAGGTSSYWYGYTTSSVTGVAGRKWR